MSAAALVHTRQCLLTDCGVLPAKQLQSELTTPRLACVTASEKPSELVLCSVPRRAEDASHQSGTRTFACDIEHLQCCKILKLFSFVFVFY